MRYDSAVRISQRAGSAELDLNAIEEANAYQRLAEEFGYSPEEVAKTVGKSRPHVANTLRLLKLSKPVQELIATQKLDAGHARSLVGLDDQEQLAARHLREIRAHK